MQHTIHARALRASIDGLDGASALRASIDGWVTRARARCAQPLTHAARLSHLALTLGVSIRRPRPRRWKRGVHAGCSPLSVAADSSGLPGGLRLPRHKPRAWLGQHPVLQRCGFGLLAKDMAVLSIVAAHGMVVEGRAVLLCAFRFVQPKMSRGEAKQGAQWPSTGRRQHRRW